MSGTISRRPRIEGRVQGVGFRFSMCREAGKQGAVGWVRNRTDGSVEALVQGPAAAVEAMIQWARRGPPSVNVTRVEVGALADGEARTYLGFESVRTG